MLGLVGGTSMDARVAAVTVRVVTPESPPNEAVMEAVPLDAPVARPAAVIVAPVVEELQEADAVMSCLVVSEKMATALNCRVVPRAMVGLVGVTSMDARVAAVTVRVVTPESPPNEAVMEAVPLDAPVARPAAVIVAAAVEELQVADAVMSCLVVSEKMATALNCRVVPKAMLGLVGGGSRGAKVIPSPPTAPPPPPPPPPHPARRTTPKTSRGSNQRPGNIPFFPSISFMSHFNYGGDLPV